MRRRWHETSTARRRFRRVALYLQWWLVISCGGVYTTVSAADTTTILPPDAQTAPTVVPHDGFNLQLVDMLPEHYLITQLTTPAHNWFAGTFTNLPTDTLVTIGLSLAGNDTPRNHADVRKWAGILPVMSYSNPALPATYEWFTKDAAGHWQSSDLCTAAADREAGTGVVPRQTSVPPAVAPQFLSADGQTWVPWRPIASADAVPMIDIFRMQLQSACPTVTVAMRVPYPPTYAEASLQRLRAAKLPGVTVETLGMTPQHRPLHVIRVEAPNATPSDLTRPTILVYAREHGTEPDGSWAVEGVLRWLLSEDPAAQQSRRTTTWLLIPLLNPDDAAQATYRLGDDYTASVQPPSPVARAYATYLITRMNAGGRLDLVVNLHNIEGTEGPNILDPVVHPTHRDAIVAVNTRLFAQAKAAGYTVGDPQGWQVGEMRQRLGGWCGSRFGALELVYELNACAPTARLSLPRLQGLGAILGQTLAAYVQSPDFAPIAAGITQRLAVRTADAATWWTTVGHPAAARTPFDLFTKGF